MRFGRAFVLCLALLGFHRPAAAEPQSMVAAANPMAVQAGLDMLERGGTAMDAAVAIQMMLGVVEPQASGIGGGGFLVYYDAASGQTSTYDGRETAPAKARPDMFLGPDGKDLDFRLAVASGLSVGVPGAVAMLELAHKERGKLAWADLFRPAIAAARDGFPAPPRLARALGIFGRSLAADPSAQKVYFNADRSPKRAGEPIVNEALAQTLEHLAERGAAGLKIGRAHV